MTQRHAARRSAGCCFIQSASCGAPIRQDCIDTSAKSEVATICSWQFAGDARLHSTAMILIMARTLLPLHRQILASAAPTPAVPLTVDRDVFRWKYPVIEFACFANEALSLAIRI